MDNWVRVGTPDAASGVRMSPNGRWVAFTTSEVIPPDVDLDPHALNLYLVDTDTNTYHLVPPATDGNPWTPSAIALSDDGTMLMQYTFSGVTHEWDLFTVGGGVVPIDPPADLRSCRWSFASGGGFDLGCDGAPAINRFVGLYHWNVGDAAATGVSVAGDLDGQFNSVSPNGRYLEETYISSVDSPVAVRVWDLSTDTVLPYQFISNYAAIPLETVGLTISPQARVGDDGRLPVEVDTWSTVLDSYKAEWWDPHTGARQEMTGFPPMKVSVIFDQGYFTYQDWYWEIGHNYFTACSCGLGAVPNVNTILGNFGDPTARWKLPFFTTEVTGLAPDGTVVLISKNPVNPGDPAGPGLYVRKGPLP
jgi:hypothetical protein